MKARHLLAGAVLGVAAGWMTGAAMGEALPESPQSSTGDVVAAYAGNLLKAEARLLEIVGAAGGLVMGSLVAASMDMRIDAAEEE